MSATRAAALLPAIFLASCGVNAVPTAEEAAKKEWADVQAAFQSRANLIPNLVATVQGAAGSEERILTQVTEARSRATSINITTDDLSNPAELARFQAAQNQLTQALGSLRTIVEAYPQLQSQQGFRDLSVALEGAENRVRIEVGQYNEAVQRYNTTIRTFPNAVGAKVFYGAEPMTPYQATLPGAENAPRVNFDAPAPKS
ncbi:MAG: LemA family protein [uncultured Sphingomonadaceae bacterium]|uniref:LemA family protein n=1 Tax=uncultured Sphingomonadaceae bacterium TaxID=169976 RepID=A0A6J4S3U7_9SPHN|nr:MAG: LemA family protein [uncultured Sphingomonadaceae bacterium]